MITIKIVVDYEDMQFPYTVTSEQAEAYPDTPPGGLDDMFRQYSAAIEHARWWQAMLDEDFGLASRVERRKAQ